MLLHIVTRKLYVNIFRGLKHLNYHERLTKLGLTVLDERKTRGDTIQYRAIYEVKL